MERVENKLKYKLMARQLDELAINRDEYSKRVEQKLHKKFGKLNQINDNLKIMDCLPAKKQTPDSQDLHAAYPMGSNEDKKVRYSKEIAPAGNNWPATAAEGIETEHDMVKNYETELYDDYRQEMASSQSIKKNDFVHMAVHYKNLCRTYKKQLIDSHRTIRELHSTIEQMERKHWEQKRQKKNLQLMNIECEENMKLTLSKCTAYCEKINKFSEVLTAYSDKESQEEIIFGTLKNVLKEKRQIRVFSKTFNELICYIAPGSISRGDLYENENIDFTGLNKAADEALKHLKNNSLKNIQCRCSLNRSGANSFEYTSSFSSNNSRPNSKKGGQELLQVCQYSDSSSSTSSSSLDAVPTARSQSLDRKKFNDNNSSNKNKSTISAGQRPTIEYLVSCMNLVRELFDVNCFHNIPTKLNEVYYKLGQLNNFKKAIQNIFAPDKNYSLEKLISAVQITHNQLNEQLSNNLKSALNSTNLHNVIDKFNMYDEYFPLFRELLDQIMKHLEVSRLDQIMPSIKALKILATPTVS